MTPQKGWLGLIFLCIRKDPTKSPASLVRCMSFLKAWIPDRYTSPVLRIHCFGCSSAAMPSGWFKKMILLSWDMKIMRRVRLNARTQRSLLGSRLVGNRCCCRSEKDSSQKK